MVYLVRSCEPATAPLRISDSGEPPAGSAPSKHRLPDPADSDDSPLPAPSATFLRACARARVAPEQLDALWRLFHTAWQDRPPAARVEAVLADHAHWLLFQASRQGDSEASRSFERHWTRIIRRLARRGFTPDQVEELRSRFFERLYGKAALFRWQSPFSAYLHTTLLNLCRDEIRRLRRARSFRQELETDSATGISEAPDPERAAMIRQDLERIHQALRRLKPLDRHIVVACLFNEESGQELAAKLGMTRSALYQRFRRAKLCLRRLVEQEPGG